MQRSPVHFGISNRQDNTGLEAKFLARRVIQRESGLRTDLAGAIRFPAPGFVADRGRLAKAYAARFARKGGRFLVDDARTLDFGHQHHGLTLGPAAGRLLAEMMTGETPFADPKPFAVERFG